MRSFKSYISHVLSEDGDKSFTKTDSNLRSAGYNRSGSLAHPTNGKAVHTYSVGKGKKAAHVHVHVQNGVVSHTENSSGPHPDYVAIKKKLMSEGEDSDYHPAKTSTSHADRNVNYKRHDQNVKEEDAVEENLEEGWFFGDRYKRIGNKHATHRVTFHHTPTNSKHTVDVTAPSDRHAESHVHRHVLGGRNGTAPIKIKRIQHLHESLEIRHAINHPDSQARHHAREHKKAVKSMDRLIKPYYVGGATDKMVYDSADHYETAQYHATKYKKRLAQLDAGKNKNEDLQEISKGLATRYLEKAKPAYDAKRKELNKPDHTGPVWGDMKGRIKKFSDQVDKLGRRRKGINRAQDRLKEEVAEGKGGVTVAIPVEVDGKKYSAVNGQAYVHSNMIMGRWNTQKRPMRKALKPGAHHDKVIAALEKHQSSRGLGEGLASKIMNAAKNLNKRLTPGSARIAQTREKVGYDNAKGPDLRPRGKALRSVERIEWSKANPVTRPKPIVPMGKLPDKLWSADSDKPKPKRVTDDSLDRPMFRKAGAMSRRFKTEDLEEASSIVGGRRIYHAARGLSPEEEASDNRAAYNDTRREKVNNWSKKTDDEKAYAVKRAARTDKLRATLAGKKKAAGAAKRAERKVVRDHQKKMDSVKSPTGRPFGKSDGPDTRSDFQKKVDVVKDRIANRPFGGKSTVEELEPKSGQKLLKELPKRDPKTGKLVKSAESQRVEDCIKMSGKKEKIDTEPTMNNLVTTQGGGSNVNQ